MTGPYMVTEHTQGKSLKIDRNPVWEENLAAGVPEDPGHQQRRRLRHHDRRAAGRAGAADQERPGGLLVRPVVLHRRGGQRAEQRPGDQGPASSAIPSLRISYATMNINRPAVRQREGAPGGELRDRPRGDGQDPAAASCRRSPTSGHPRRHDAAGGLRPAEVYPSTPDVEKAKALLQEAGVKTPVDAGTLYYPEAGVNADIAQQIVSDLKNVGLNMKHQGPEHGQLLPVHPEPGEQGRHRDRRPGRPTTRTASRTSSRCWSPARPTAGRTTATSRTRSSTPRSPASTRCRPARSAARRGASSRRACRRQGAVAQFVTRNNLNLVSEKYGGYYYDSGKTHLSRPRLREPVGHLIDRTTAVRPWRPRRHGEPATATSHASATRSADCSGDCSSSSSSRW